MNRGPAEEHDTSNDETGGLNELLPEQSILDFQEYLAMQRAIGNEARFRVLYALTQQGAMSQPELEDALCMDTDNLSHCLSTLCDVGLVQNRMRKTPESEDLFSYYVASSLGEGILEHGVVELMKREQEFKRRYSSGQ